MKVKRLLSLSTLGFILENMGGGGVLANVICIAGQ
jgi:hypothetical protein